jgi:hypothetical protein
VFPWLVAAAALLVRPSALELVTPAPCPGLLELISIRVALLGPALTVGAVFGALGAIGVACAVAGAAAMVARTTGSLALSALFGVAVALSPLLPEALAPPWHAAAFAACTAVALAVPWVLRSRVPVPRALAAGSVVMLPALVVPSWTIVSSAALALLAWITARSIGGLRRALISIGCALLAVAVAVFSASRPDAFAEPSLRSFGSCVLPRADFTLAHLRAIAGATSWALGPLVMGLALFGVVARVSRHGAREIWRIAAVVGGCAVLAAIAVAEVRMASIPLVLVLWWLAAIGARETLAATGPRLPARAVAAALLALVPVLQHARTGAEERDDWVRPHGHERLTLQATRAMLNVAESDAALVEEDASVDVMLRAATAGGRRATKRFVVIPRSSDAVADAFARGRVYAFPWGQLDLGERGYAFEPISAGRRRPNGVADEIRGLAAVTGRRACHVIRDQWTDIGDASANGRFTIVFDAEPSRGPVQLLLGGAAASMPVPDGWPLRTLRGFRYRIFRSQDEVTTARLLAEGEALGVPTGHPVLALPAVLELTLHRTPRAPLALPVLLRTSMPVGVARVGLGGTSDDHLTVCDAAGARVTPFSEAAESGP